MERITVERCVNPAYAAHQVTLEGRERLTVSGVEDVERFDENTIIMSTAAGTLVVAGENLHIGKLSLDGGELHVDGQIDSLSYEDQGAGRGGLLGRLFWLMEIQISDQAAAFLAAVLLGAALGLLYDLLRCLRAALRGRGTALADGLYSALVLVSVFYLAMVFGQGRLRIYMVLGRGGGRGAVFLSVQPSAASPVGLLAGLPGADGGHSAGAGGTSGAAGKKFFQKCKKVFLFWKKWFNNNKQILGRP